jgi:hypothetical protein
MTTLELCREEWLAANEAAVNEAATYLGKKGNFNPTLEKPWPKWEALRKIVDIKWYAYSSEINKNTKQPQFEVDMYIKSCNMFFVSFLGQPSGWPGVSIVGIPL